MLKYFDYQDFINFIVRKKYEEKIVNATSIQTMLDEESEEYKKEAEIIKQEYSSVFTEKKFNSAMKPVEEYFDKMNNVLNNLDTITINDGSMLLNSSQDKKNKMVKFYTYQFEHNNDSKNYGSYDDILGIVLIKNSKEADVETDMGKLKQIKFFFDGDLEISTKYFLTEYNFVTSSDKKKDLQMYFEESFQHKLLVLNKKQQYNGFRETISFVQTCCLEYPDLFKKGFKLNFKSEEEMEMINILHDVNLKDIYKKSFTSKNTGPTL